MYEELIESSRACAMRYNGNCDRCLFSGMSNDKNGDCYQQLHKAAADAIEELSAKVDSLQIFAYNISKLPDCNTCMKKPMCEFMPKYGEYCRINCPAWLGESEPPKEENDV